MPNHLINENSPYLLQHAHNPVEWYPWGPEALEKARSFNLPIFLSIGYAACHWCHVMAHESFEDQATAAIMNERFINIKVDREERPDLDSLYMNAVVALTGQGGWPMSVFLTPDGQPFFGGTYFPPVQRYNMPAFQEVLLNVSRVWQTERSQVIESSQNITDHLQKVLQASSQPFSTPLESHYLDQAARLLTQNYDWKNGGWGQSPKFPQPMAIEFLLTRAAAGDHSALELASHALWSMAKGGMYDVVGGGFSRYSTDNNWLVPHFEKMLYDNALLARSYLHAFLLTGNPFFRRVCTETLDFIVRELRNPSGGFYSSLDADSEGEEGKYYLWTPPEIAHSLGDSSDADFILSAYGVTTSGNFEGRTVLQRVKTDEELAGLFSMELSQIPERFSDCHHRMLAYRSQRVRPATDDKVLVSWNALMLTAFAEAARYLQSAHYLEVARANANFLLLALHPSDQLLRSWRKGKAAHPAYLEDYASLILGLLSLYQSDPDPRWYVAAVQFTQAMTVHFSDPQGGFFDTRDDQPALFLRPKDTQDNATPSGNSLAVMALLQMSALSGRGDWREKAEGSLRMMQVMIARYPTGFSFWLSAMDFALNPVKEAAILGGLDDPNTQSLLDVLWSAYRPRLVAAISPFPPAVDSPPILHNRQMIESKPTAYICQHFVCKQPVTAPSDLKALLQG